MNRLLTILLLSTVTGCVSAPKLENPGVTTQSVENDIRTHLPIGSRESDVIAFLDQRKIPHSWAKRPMVVPDDSIVTPNIHFENGLIRDVRTDGVVITSIQIEFKFDDSDSKLVNYSVREVYTGP
jgi:hypothetical protein